MPDKNQYQPNDCYQSITIASGQTTSPEIDLSGTDLCGIFFPAAMTGSTLKLQASETPGGTFRAVQKDEVGGGDYSITVSVSKYVPITNLAIVAGLRFIKLVSGATEAADRVIVLSTRPI